MPIIRPTVGPIRPTGGIPTAAPVMPRAPLPLVRNPAIPTRSGQRFLRGGFRGGNRF